MRTKEKLNVREGLDIAIDTGLQLIPGVGSAISTAYFGTKQAKQFKRIENFYTELAQEMELIKDKIVKFENQYSDGFISLTEILNNNIENEHQQQKIESYKKYMKTLLTSETTISNYDNRKVFLDTLSKMSILEMKLLISLYKNNSVQRHNSVSVKDIQYGDLSQYAILGTVSRLKSYGFFISYPGSISVGGGEDNALEECISVSDYGCDFIKFTLE